MSRARDAVVDRVPTDRRDHVLGSEVLLEELRHRGGEDERRVEERLTVGEREAPVAGQLTQLADRRRSHDGGVRSNIGTTARATRARSRSKRGSACGIRRREAPHVLGGATEVVVEPQVRAVGKTFSVAPAASTRIPRSTRRMSRQIDRRSIDNT